MSRQAWQDFICSPDRAGRHLSPIGKDVSGSTGESIDLAVLQAFLDRLRGAADDVVLLSDAVDLLTGGYGAFMRDAMPRLLDALSNEVLSRESVVGPGLRGNPLWSRTITGRMSGFLSPVQFLSRTSHRSFDLPENRLLAWLASDVRRAVDNIVRQVGSRSLHPMLQEMAVQCEAASRHHWFGDVEVPPALSSAMLTAASRHRRPEYRQAARLASRRADLGAQGTMQWWNNVLSLLSVGYLEPVKDDRLFELFVLVLVMDVLGEELGFGDPVEVGLITSKRKHVALFEKDDVTVKVYFNQTPATVLSSITRYGRFVSEHVGVSGDERRPDILLVVDRGGSRRLILVEVKETSDRDYISDSIYKVFGYLYDFQDVFQDEDGLRAVLVVPEGVGARAGVPFGMMRLAAADRREAVAEAVESAMTN